MNEKEFYILASISSKANIGFRSLRRLLDNFQTLEKATRSSHTELIKAGFKYDKARLIKMSSAAEGQDLIKNWSSKKLHFISYFDEEFPENLRDIDYPPAYLFIYGNLNAIKKNLIAIIGTRKCTNYGESITGKIINQLKELNYGSIAGLAQGIDTVSHRESLRLGVATVAVMAGGLNRIYPRQNEKLFYDIADSNGAVISEVFPDCDPLPQRFVARNRLVSALSELIIVVEAGERSGTITTVNHGLSQGKEILAIPGRIDSPVSVGCHMLIQNGAKILVDIAEIKNLLAEKIGLKDQPPLIQAIHRGINSIFALQKTLNLSVPELLIDLNRYELVGKIRRDLNGNYFVN